MFDNDKIYFKNVSCSYRQEGLFSGVIKVEKFLLFNEDLMEVYDVLNNKEMTR